jgi:8-hydroxy-5-deazaflavin:NADPH oxidoreductase
MNIGIIGTGRMGYTLATIWHNLGHHITLGSREPDQAQARAQQIAPTVHAASYPDTANQSDILLFAFPWYALTDVQRTLGNLQGKIIIDCLNPFMSSGSLALGHKWSAAEEIQQQFPLSYVVKAFNGIHYQNLHQPLFSGHPASLFDCSDYDSAKTAVAQLAQQMGFAPVDSGPLKHARYLEPLAALWVQMAFHLGRGSDMAFVLLPR